MNKLLYRIFKLANNSSDIKPHEMFLGFYKQNKPESKDINIFLNHSNNDKFVSFLNSKLDSKNFEELATFCMDHSDSESRELDLTNDHIREISKILYEEFKSKIKSYGNDNPKDISKDLDLLSPIWSLLNHVSEYLKYHESKDIDKITLYENKHIDEYSKELRLMSLLKKDPKFITFLESDFFHEKIDPNNLKEFGATDPAKFMLALYFIYCSINNIQSNVSNINNEILEEYLMGILNVAYNFKAYPEYIEKVFRLIYALIKKGMEEFAVDEVLSQFLDNNYFPANILTQEQKEFIVEIAEKKKDYSIAGYIASKSNAFYDIYDLNYPWVSKTVEEINEESNSYGY